MTGGGTEECCDWGGGGGGCDLVEGEDFEVGGGGEVATGGVGLDTGGGVCLGGEPPPELPLPPQCDLLQSTGRAAGEEHSLEERWSVFRGIQFWLPSPETEAQTGGTPVK